MRRRARSPSTPAVDHHEHASKTCRGFKRWSRRVAVMHLDGPGEAGGSQEHPGLRRRLLERLIYQPGSHSSQLPVTGFKFREPPDPGVSTNQLVRGAPCTGIR